MGEEHLAVDVLKQSFSYDRMLTKIKITNHPLLCEIKSTWTNLKNLIQEISNGGDPMMNVNPNMSYSDFLQKQIWLPMLIIVILFALLMAVFTPTIRMKNSKIFGLKSVVVEKHKSVLLIADGTDFSRLKNKYENFSANGNDFSKSNNNEIFLADGTDFSLNGKEMYDFNNKEEVI